MISHWQPVAHTSEVANPGDYVRLPGPYGQQIVVSNFDGAVKVWDNRCPHRGARIYDEKAGNAPPVCAYHGRCAKAGDVRAYPTMIEGAWVMALLDGNAAGRYGRHMPMQDLKFFARADFVFDCEVQVAIENSLDFEHVGRVHPDSLARLELIPGEVSLQGLGSSTQYFDSGIADRLDRLRLCFAPDLLPFAPDYMHSYISPYTCVASVRGHTVALQHYLPREDGKTDVVHRLYAAPHHARAKSYLRSAFATNCRTFEEDAAICARVAADFAPATEMHERRINHFREHFAGAQ